MVLNISLILEMQDITLSTDIWALLFIDPFARKNKGLDVAGIKPRPLAQTVPQASSWTEVIDRSVCQICISSYRFVFISDYVPWQKFRRWKSG